MQAPFNQPVLLESALSGLTLKHRGKVRDMYDLGDSLLIVATDRLSAFDVVLPEGIPGKGAVLTALSAFWFRWLYEFEDILPNHFITTDLSQYPAACRLHHHILDGRSMLVQKASPLPVECIVRGYLSGSGWSIFTPSTKAEHGEHDLNISLAEMVSMVGKETAALVRDASLKIYRRAVAHAETKGIIIADTKLEFGIDSQSGQPMLIDEVLTPDSSRFWPRAAYVPGRPQPSFDKQFVRDYLNSLGWNKQPPAPHLPPDIIRQTHDRYLEAYRLLTAGEH